MRYRKLSPTGDYLFGNGLNDFWINVPDAPAQAVKTRLLLWLGEWFLDLTEGTPFLEGILGKHSQATADQTIQNRVTGTQGVTDILNYSSVLNPDRRTLSVEMEIDTVYGPTVAQLQNYVNY